MKRGGVYILWVGGRYTMGKKLDIPWIGVSKCHGNRGQNTRSGGQYIMGKGVDIPWVVGSIYHG